MLITEKAYIKITDTRYLVVNYLTGGIVEISKDLKDKMFDNPSKAVFTDEEIADLKDNGYIISENDYTNKKEIFKKRYYFFRKSFLDAD